MDRRIWLLAWAQFAAATGAYAFVGLLAPLAVDLGVSLATAGQLSAAYALTYAAAGAPMAALTARLGRRTLLVAGLGLVGLFNLATAFAPDFTTALLLRIATGLSVTLVLPGVAASMLVPAHKRAKALALVLSGLTLAFSFGIPLGSLIGGWYGWRACFLFSGTIALLGAALVRLGLPPLPSTDRGATGSAARIMRAPILMVLATSLLAFCGLFCVAAYLGPIVTAATGITGGGIGAIQAFVGLGSILGIYVGSRAAGRATRLEPWLMVLLSAALAAYSLLLAFPPAFWHAAPLALVVFTGSVALFALAPMWQARLVDLAPEDRAVALALSGSVALGGQGIGAAYGGAVIAMAGLAWCGLAGALVTLAGALLAARSVAWRRRERAAVH